AGLILALGLAGLAYWQSVIAQQNEVHAKDERDKATHNFRLAQQAAESLVIDIARGMRTVQGRGAETLCNILYTARATFRQLAAAAPDDLGLQSDRSVLLDELGETYQTLGDLDAALRACRDSLAIRERLVAVDPSNPLWQAALSQSHTRIG